MVITTEYWPMLRCICPFRLAACGGGMPFFRHIRVALFLTGRVCGALQFGIDKG